MGWFIGNEMLVVAGILMFCGALLFQSNPTCHNINHGHRQAV